MGEAEASSVKSSSEEMNRTYVISTMTGRWGEVSNGGRLTLQRRNTNNKNTAGGEQEVSENTENQSHGKRLTLQRRTRAGAGGLEKGSLPHTHSHTKTEKPAWTCSKILSEPNSRAGSTPLRSARWREKGLTDVTKPVNTPGKMTEKAQKTFISTPTGQTRFERISLKKEVFENLSAKDPKKVLTAKQTGVERQKQSCAESKGGTIPGSGDTKLPVISQNRSTISTMRKTTTQQCTVPTTKSKSPPCETRVSVQSGSQSTSLSCKELKMENSTVTVAVRVRPFSHR